jgi:hypothetical protein
MPRIQPFLLDFTSCTEKKNKVFVFPNSVLNLLAPEFDISIVAHPVCKMQIIQEPKKVAL